MVFDRRVCVVGGSVSPPAAAVVVGVARELLPRGVTVLSTRPRVQVLEQGERVVVGGGGVEGLARFFFLRLFFFFLPRAFFGGWASRAAGSLSWGTGTSPSISRGGSWGWEGPFFWELSGSSCFAESLAGAVLFELPPSSGGGNLSGACVESPGP